MPTLFETESPIFDQDKTRTHGKIFVLDHDANRQRIWKLEEMDTAGGKKTMRAYLWSICGAEYDQAHPQG